MSKKKINKKSLTIYGNVILNTSTDLVSGILSCSVNDITVDINVTNSNEGNYNIVLSEDIISYGDKITLSLEAYDSDNAMYIIADEVQINSGLELTPSIMVNFIITDYNISNMS